jgi:phosphomannomutase/phosphoglucomutase
MQGIDSIFREYDIRGIVGEELTSQVFEDIGSAFGLIVSEQTQGSPTIVVGRDNRPSSQELAASFIEGLVSSGVMVTDIGTVPTPMVYWSETELHVDAGVQITGSHNPVEWNGVKMSLGGRPFYGQDIQRLKTFHVAENHSTERGSYSRTDITKDYIQDIVGRFQLKRPLKVVLDCGNGAGSLVGVDILTGIGARVVPLYCESDGTFPNHHPDPTVDENLKDLIDKVKEENADLGIAFDGDADRIGAVDNKGHIVRGDLLLLLLAQDILQKNGQAKMIFDVKCSQVVPEEFAKAGGQAIMWKTGHSLIKKKMSETGADIAGELSGHIFIADDYLGFDDAPYCAARLLELASRSDESFFDMVNKFRIYISTPEIRIEVPESQKKKIIEAATDHFASKYEVICVDGVRILFEGGWGLLRASNTQPILVARFEAEKADQLQDIRSEVEGWLITQGVTI